MASKVNREGSSTSIRRYQSRIVEACEQEQFEDAIPVLRALELVEGLASPIKEELFVAELFAQLRDRGRLEPRSEYLDHAA